MNTATKIRTTLEKRTEAVDALRTLYNRAEGRDLTKSERLEEDNLKDTIADYDRTLERSARSAENEARDADFREALGIAETREGPDGDDGWAARGDLPLNADEFRDLTASNVGSALIPAEHGTKVVENVVRTARVAGLAQKFVTTSDEFVMPTITANPTAAVVPEGATIGESDPTYTPVTASIVKTGILTQVSIEAWNDSRPEVRKSLSRQHLLSHARKWDALVLTGSGSGEPQGIVGAPGVNTVTAAAAPSLGIIHDAIARAEATGLDPESLTLVAPAQVWSAIEAETDSNGQYLLGSPRSATDKSVFGVPVVLTDALPTDGGAGANEATIVLGDFSFCGLALREDARVDVSQEYAFDKGLITVRSLFRMSSAVLAAEAFEVVDGLTLS